MGCINNFVFESGSSRKHSSEWRRVENCSIIAVWAINCIVGAGPSRERSEWTCNGDLGISTRSAINNFIGARPLNTRNGEGFK